MRGLATAVQYANKRLAQMEAATWIPRWSQMQRVHNHGVVKSATWWFLLVPLVAACLAGVQKTIPLKLLGDGFVIRLALPFSWSVFYFSAAAFTLAGAVVATRQAEVVASYKAFPAFAGEGRGSREIVEAFVAVLRIVGDRSLPGQAFAKEFVDMLEHRSAQKLQNAKDTLTMESIAKLLRSAEVEEEKQGEAFWLIWKTADRSRPLSRAMAGALYGVGFGLLAVVLAQKFQTVWRLAGIQEWLHGVWLMLKAAA